MSHNHSTHQNKQNIQYSIVVPAYKECTNLRPLCERLFNSLAIHNLASLSELIIVDDNSQDGSVQVVEELRQQYNIRIIVRTKERGLSSAVLRGFDEAKSMGVLICMDADLQHPPEKVPEMINSLRNKEFAIGTRYSGGNSIDKDWPLYRRVISSGARALARPLTSLSDPMTGFFGIQRAALDRSVGKLNAVGFKICLELFVKCQIKSHAEVPIVFGVRTAGESKLSSKVIINYLAHLWELYLFQMPWFLVLLAALGVLIGYLLLRVLYGL